MVYYCWKDGSKASNLAELPDKWVDFKDDWSKFPDPIHSWKNTIREGKTRTYKGSLMIACDWEPEELLRKVTCEMDQRNGGMVGGKISFELKENQILNTGIKNCLFGWPVNVNKQSTGFIFSLEGIMKGWLGNTPFPC